jgi:hypothetical protein
LEDKDNPQNTVDIPGIECATVGDAMKEIHKLKHADESDQPAHGRKPN